MIRIAICDDTMEDRKRLLEALIEYDQSFDIVQYENGESLLDDFQDSKCHIDMLFMDIYLPGLNGINTVQRIRTDCKDAKIIFVSSSPDFYPQAYEVFAYNYLLKPFDKIKLFHVLDCALEEIGKKKRHKITFSYKSKVYSLDCRDIAYIESSNKIVLFHLENGDTLQCYSKLDEIEEELIQQYFIRCHKSFIVNASFISEMGENYFYIGQDKINISKRYLKLAKEQYFAYLFSKMSRGR